MILPDMFISTCHEFIFADLLLFKLTFFNVELFGLDVVIVRLWKPLIVSEEATARQVDNFALWGLKRQIIVLFVPERFSDLIR